METEYQSLVENETWTLERAPTDRKVITGRWVFKIKNQRDGLTKLLAAKPFAMLGMS